MALFFYYPTFEYLQYILNLKMAFRTCVIELSE